MPVLLQNIQLILSYSYFPRDIWWEISQISQISQLSCTNSAGCLATDALLGASVNSLWESLLPPNFFNKVSGVHFEKVSSLIPSFLLYNPILIS